MKKDKKIPFNEKVKNLIEKIMNAVSAAFGEIKEFVNVYVKPAVVFVNNFKELINKPEVTNVLEILFKDLSPKIIETIKKFLPEVVSYLGIVIECSAEDDFESFIKCLIEHFRGLAEGDKHAKFLKLASNISLRAFNADKKEEEQLNEPIADYYASGIYLKVLYNKYVNETA